MMSSTRLTRWSTSFLTLGVGLLCVKKFASAIPITLKVPGFDGSGLVYPDENVRDDPA